MNDKEAAAELEQPADIFDPAPADHALALRNPSLPVTLDDLQAMKGAAVEVIEARAAILETARRRAIRMTHPEDWLLFKSPDDRVTGYLQDCGCDRIRDVFGIEVFDVSEPRLVPQADGQTYMMLLYGSGRSRLTMQTVEAMPGGRPSTDDFSARASGAALELLVAKAARANLDGNITRELAGLKNVPVDELAIAWQGTPKLVKHCRLGKGFGTQAERYGAAREGAPELEPPTCHVCAPVNGQAVRLRYMAARDNRKAFYGCPNYASHPNQRATVDAAEWIAGAPARAAALAAGAKGGQP